MNDGVDEPTGKGTDRVATGFGRLPTSSGIGFAGTPSESGLLKTLLAPTLGVRPTDVPDLGVPVGEVPDLATLLLGPIARGMEVNVR